MPTLSQGLGAAGPKGAGMSAAVSPQHYLRLIIHRKWLVVAVFVVVSAITVTVAHYLPNVYTSQTVILVDPQKVPENYVRSTVTGDVRNRLSTLSQQILSETRLQKIIDELHLYPEERKQMVREEVVAKMRADINVSLIGELGGESGGGQDLQAFKVTYSGKDPRLVAHVTNELASLFIEENLKAREQQATGTTEFLSNQLEETRKTLEEQEGKLRDFKLKHIGEMPEQQTATLQILGQLQSQLQLESEALNRADQQRSLLQTMVTQSVPVLDLDDGDVRSGPGQDESKARNSKAANVSTKKANTAGSAKARLAALLARGLTDKHPDVRKARLDVAEEEAKSAAQETGASVQDTQAAKTKDTPPGDPVSSGATVARRTQLPVNTANPVLESQLKSIDDEIQKHVAEQQRLKKLVAGYQAKLEVIPVREQQISDLVRDYEISKGHYAQLLEKQLSAETATQLEIRQKGERFSVLDPAQPSEKPSRPKRMLIDAVGSLGGLILGLVLALSSELFGTTITAPEQITDDLGVPVLEVVPIIQTAAGGARRKGLIIRAAVSVVAVTVLASFAFLFYHYRS